MTVTKGRHAITHCMVADESARINLSLWDTQVGVDVDLERFWIADIGDIGGFWWIGRRVMFWRYY